MKKNLFMSMLAMAGMLLATSCSQEELLPEPSNGDFVNATFTIGTTDGIGTRATIGNGTKADKVACAVYDAEGTELTDLYKVVNVVDMKATYEVRLAKGQNYRVAFFAYNSAADAYNVQDLKNITVKGDQNSNIENRDAFTNYVDVEATVNAINKNVTLYRPFAQLNLGVDNTELEAARKAGVVIAKSKIVVTNVYNQFSAYDNAVVATAEPMTMTFAMNAIPTERLEVDVNRDGTIANDETFNYLALNYLLVGDAGTEKSLTDVEFVWENADKSKTNNPTTHFLNIPVQRNYRTNIIGSLLTNPATFNIIIDADFIDSPEKDYIVSVWDGESVETPTVDANNVIRISSAAELVGLMEVTGNSIFIGKTIELQCNIDLGHHRVKGIGGGSNFAGVFDGKGFTISNFEVDARDRSYYAGLFNQVSHGGTIKNLTVANATIKGNSMVGAVASSLDSDAVVENCKAINCTLIGVKKVGSVVGYSAGSTVKDNYAENCVIEYSEKEASEILGYEYTGSTVSGNTFNNITFVVSATALATELTPDANGVITLTRDYTVTGNWTPLVFSENITINGNGHTIQGLDKALVLRANGVNISINDLTIAKSNISYSASDANETALGVGGFISYMDYAGTATFNNCHLKNSTVNGNERAAGLIGYTSGNQLTVTNCTVEGCTIKATGSTGGIVAHTQTTVSISGSKVENSTIESTEDRSTKAAIAGGIIGTIMGATTFDNVTVSGNTVINNGAKPLNEKVGRVVSPGSLTDN